MAGHDLEQQRKWDERYRAAPVDVAPQACHALRAYAHLLPAHGEALDLACGLGGNALWLARRGGLSVHAWDISPVAIDRLVEQAEREGLAIHARARDGVNDPPGANGFDVIVVSHFLQRELAPLLAAALRPGGLLYYQTFTRARVGQQGPGPAYRLAENELLALFPGLILRAYQEEGLCGDRAQGFRDEALLVAQRPALTPRTARA